MTNDTQSGDKRLPPLALRANNFISTIVNTLPYQRDFFGAIQRQFDLYGDIYTIEMMGAKQVLIRHPDHIYTVTVKHADKYHKDNTYKHPTKGLAKFLGTGLLVSDGEFWKRQRKLMAPAFHHKRIANYADTMVELTQQRIDEWHAAIRANGGSPTRIDVDEAMMRATLDIVAKTLFTFDVQNDAAKVATVMNAIQEFSADMVGQMLPEWIPLPRRAREAQAVRDLDSIVYRAINQHKTLREDNGDLLYMLLNARDEDGTGMSDKQIRDEVVTLFLAGHETTANTLNWTWVLLAQHPEVEAKLHEELDTVLAGHAPTMDDLKNLPYTARVIKESMRLYPPAFGFSRVAIEDTTIGDYDIPKGTVIMVLDWATHRDPRWYPDPLAFKPERWTPEFEESLPKMAYLPFGGGPRVCIGSAFAQMEAQILLAMLASQFKLRLEPGQIVKPDPLLTLRPKGGLPMLVEARARRIAPQPSPVLEAVI